MKETFSLAKLNFKILINNIKFADKIDKIRGVFLIFVSFLFFLGVYIISYQVILYISTLPVIGSLFVIRIIGLAFLSSFIMVIFSSLTVCLSTMYNNEDLVFLISLPIKFNNIFLIKFISTIFRASWMLLVVLIPFSLAFAYVKNFVFYQYVILIIAVLIKLFISITVGSFIAISLSYYFPYKKLRNIILVVIVLLTAFLYSLLRVSQPEKLLSLEKFPELFEYLDFLAKPVGNSFPSWWASEIFRGFMIGDSKIVIFNLLKLFLVAVLVFILFYILGQKMYFKGIFFDFVSSHKKQTIKNNFQISFKPKLQLLIEKEIKLFFREPVQWIQIVIVISLIIIYIFSIAKLPIEMKYVRVSVAFFNLGSIIFILTALVLRFIFIQPSLEYKNFWLIKSFPIKFINFFIIKFLVYFPFVVVPALIMCIISSYVLRIEKILTILSLIITLISSLVVTIAGYSLGILFPKKEYQDIAQIETSFGGLIFIVLSLCYVVLILSSLAGLIRRYILSQPFFIKEVIFSLILFISINFVYVFIPLYYATKKFLKEY